MSLYSVTARVGWDTVFAGHWVATCPKHAIALAKASIDANPLMSQPVNAQWSAKKSKADAAAMALNA